MKSKSVDNSYPICESTSGSIYNPFWSRPDLYNYLVQSFKGKSLSSLTEHASSMEERKMHRRTYVAIKALVVMTTF